MMWGYDENLSCSEGYPVIEQRNWSGKGIVIKHSNNEKMEVDGWNSLPGGILESLGHGIIWVKNKHNLI